MDADAGPLERLQEYCEGAGQLFPLLAARMGSMVARGRHEADALSLLCHANVRGVPDQWAETYELARPVVEGVQSRVDSTFFTLEWYAEVLSRMHLNSFRVDCPGITDFADLRKALVDSLDPNPAGNGTAVYLLSSFLNHSCEPNLTQHFQCDHTIQFAAKRDIEKGEQLFTSYIDESLPRAERQNQLDFGYGFKCNCPKCRDQLAEAS